MGGYLVSQIAASLSSANGPTFVLKNLWNVLQLWASTVPARMQSIRETFALTIVFTYPLFQIRYQRRLLHSTVWGKAQEKKSQKRLRNRFVRNWKPLILSSTFYSIKDGRKERWMLRRGELSTEKPPHCESLKRDFFSAKKLLFASIVNYAEQAASKFKFILAFVFFSTPTIFCANFKFIKRVRQRFWVEATLFCEFPPASEGFHVNVDFNDNESQFFVRRSL